MYYLWKNEMGSGWQLVETSEDEECIKKREKESTRAVAALRKFGVAFKVTDFEIPENER